MAMEGDPPVRLAAAQTRGFLFADIRGYTEFVERRGAPAASELLQRYRSIVRKAIGEHAGAEIRTEGDSFYVVLPSASAAVNCALSIVAQVAAESRAHLEDPIRVGIGVHFGEVIETNEGLIGSAVNIASRLSALARPGEVLVSETVRALSRSIVSATFVSRGRHRLKGVAEPQEVFAVVGTTGDLVSPVANARQRMRVPLLIAVGLTALLAVPLVYVLANRPSAAGKGPHLGAVATSPPATTSQPPTDPVTSSPATAPTAVLATPGPIVIHNLGHDPGSGVPVLGAGDYTIDGFLPAVDLAIGSSWTDRAWHPLLAFTDHAALVLTQSGRDCCGYPLEVGLNAGSMLLEFARINTVLADPCNGGDPASAENLGGRPEDLLEWLKQHRFLEASNIRPVFVGKLDGWSVDVTVKGDPGQACAGLTEAHHGSVYLFRTAEIGVAPGALFRFRDGEKARFTILDVNEDSPLTLISLSSLRDFEFRAPWADQLIGTITPSQE
jgi:class 3 adenylate cyclase